MEIYKRCLAVIVCTCAFALDVFGAIVNIDTAIEDLSISMVEIGSPGNNFHKHKGNEYGKVDYHFWMSKTEVTNDMFVKIMNKNKEIASEYGFYYNKMGVTNNFGGINRNGTSGNFDYETFDGWGAKPVNYVNMEIALIVCNLLNGSDALDGMYKITYNADGTLNPNSMKRLLNEGFGLPTEDEWVKAAYWDSETADYNSDALPGNYNNSFIDVGSENNTSPSGVEDMGGNIAEMIATLYDVSDEEKIVSRGGHMSSQLWHTLISKRYSTKITSRNRVLGIRLAYTPEPAAYTSILSSLALAIAIMRRKRRRCL